MATIKQFVLNSRPEKAPSKNNFRLEEVPLPALKDGEVLVIPTYISVDPYLRGRMNDIPSYMPPFQIDQPVGSYMVAQVEESKSSQYRKGDKVIGLLNWSTQIIASEKEIRKIEDTSISDNIYMGVLGTVGLTAYFCVADILKPKAGETMVISGAAGGVGIAAGQIAKIFGTRVVGIAGSDQKVKLLKEKYGYDEVINYKTANVSEALKKACPDGIDTYFDNVGGSITDAVLEHMNLHGRIAVCGQIALYNNELAPGSDPRTLLKVLTKRLLVQGFLILDQEKRFGEAFSKLIPWFKEGKLKNEETITEGFDHLVDAFLGLFEGKNTGKMLVKI